jgi:glyoxylase-like metal-dependent hydrolase (beta-lactamase superfamily II)
MWFKEPGKITERLDFLGSSENCLYLLKGSDMMIIGGGMSWVAPALEVQFAAMNLEPEKLKYLVISHSHFDHCGAVPYLKRKFPRIHILASAHAQTIFSKEKTINYIASTNKFPVDNMSLQSEYEKLNLKFDGIHVDRVITKKDIINLGDGIEVHFLEVPGHTRCSIAVYVPQLKALFPADAAPPPAENKDAIFFPGPQYDFEMYKQSMERLASLEIEIYASEHYGVVTGSQARELLQQGLRQTERFRKRIIDIYQQIQDFDGTVQKGAAEILGKNKFDFMGMGSEMELMVLGLAIRRILESAKLIEKPIP